MLRRIVRPLFVYPVDDERFDEGVCFPERQVIAQIYVRTIPVADKRSEDRRYTFRLRYFVPGASELCKEFRSPNRFRNETVKFTASDRKRIS